MPLISTLKKDFTLTVGYRSIEHDGFLCQKDWQKFYTIEVSFERPLRGLLMVFLQCDRQMCQIYWRYQHSNQKWTDSEWLGSFFLTSSMVSEMCNQLRNIFRIVVALAVWKASKYSPLLPGVVPKVLSIYTSKFCTIREFGTYTPSGNRCLDAKF